MGQGLFLSADSVGGTAVGAGVLVWEVGGCGMGCGMWDVGFWGCGTISILLGANHKPWLYSTLLITPRRVLAPSACDAHRPSTP